MIIISELIKKSAREFLHLTLQRMPRNNLFTCTMIGRGHWKCWVFITFTSIRVLKKPDFKTCASFVRKSPIYDVMDASKPVCPWQLTSYSLPDRTLSKSTDIPESSASFVTPFDLAYSWGRCCCVYTPYLLLSSSKKETFYLVVQRGRFPRSGIALLCDGVFRKQHYRWRARNESETEKYEQKDREATEGR